MQFNSSSDGQGLVQDINYLIFGDSGSHTSDYPLNDVARNVNRWLDKAVTKILQADFRWEWDDTNKTDLPIANISLVANQQDYGVTAATFLKIRKVDIKDSSGNSTPLKEIWLEDLRNIADAEFQKTAGIPKYYRLQGSSIFLYPKPSYAYTNGLRIFYQRNVDYFTGTDTTKAPGIAEPFHRYLSFGAAYDYCITNGLTAKQNNIRQEMAVIEADMTAFYATRNTDKVSLKLSRNDYGQIGLADQTRSINRPDQFNIY